MQSSERPRQPGPVEGDVPPRPIVASDGLSSGYPSLFFDAGRRFALGWQDWPDDEGGPGFALVRRTPLGGLKVQERFSFDDEGWAQAWRKLVRVDGDCAERTLVALAERRALRRREERQSEERRLLDSETITRLLQATFLGGYSQGSELAAGDKCSLRFMRDQLAVFSIASQLQLVSMDYRNIEDIEIGGPGVIKKGGGFTGGSISGPTGVLGAVETRAMAAVLNALTTRTKIKTVLRLQAVNAELFFLNTEVEPSDLRIQLSYVLGSIRQIRAAAENRSRDTPAVTESAAQELGKLAALLDSGLLTREEFDALKAQIIARLQG